MRSLYSPDNCLMSPMSQLLSVASLCCPDDCLPHPHYSVAFAQLAQPHWVLAQLQMLLPIREPGLGCVLNKMGGITAGRHSEDQPSSLSRHWHTWRTKLLLIPNRISRSCALHEGLCGSWDCGWSCTCCFRNFCSGSWSTICNKMMIISIHLCVIV